MGAAGLDAGPPANPVLAADGRPALRFDKARPRLDVDRWTARPLSSERRPPLNHNR